MTAFPKLRWSAFKRQPDLDEKLRRSLIALNGDVLLSHQHRSEPLGKPTCGSLIYSYYKGIYRFLKFGHLAYVPPVRVVFYEPVLTAALKQVTGPILACVPEFCAPAPRGLARELEQRLGVGAY